MSFHQFTLLPPEIQLKIWTHSLPSPRIVDLFAVPVSESVQPKRDSSGNIAPSVNQNSTVNAPRPIWIRTFIERVYSRPHDLSHLHVCSEARSLALKRYKRVNADMDFAGEMEFVGSPEGGSEAAYYSGTLKGARPYALFDPEGDIVFLQDPPRTLDHVGGLLISSPEILLRWCPVALSSLRRLAMPYYTWRRTKNNGKLAIMRRFTGLEELFVSFLGESYTGSRHDRQTWSDVVAGSGQATDLWSHVKEVEVEVLADVEGLKRSCPEWKVPRVTVVRHRGVLMEELKE